MLSYFISYLTFFIFFMFLFFFRKKLISLLFLEGLMISCIFHIFLLGSFSSSLFLLLVCLSGFMVLDSVLGISLLISSGRLSSYLSVDYSSF